MPIAFAHAAQTKIYRDVDRDALRQAKKMSKRGFPRGCSYKLRYAAGELKLL